MSIVDRRTGAPASGDGPREAGHGERALPRERARAHVPAVLAMDPLRPAAKKAPEKNRRKSRQRPALTKTERNARIIRARAEGKSYADAAALAECSDGTAFNVAKAHEEYVAAERRRVQLKVLERLGAPVDARIEDAANPQSRTGAASYREPRETLGWVPRNATSAT